MPITCTIFLSTLQLTYDSTTKVDAACTSHRATAEAWPGDDNFNARFSTIMLLAIGRYNSIQLSYTSCVLFMDMISMESNHILQKPLLENVYCFGDIIWPPCIW